MKYTNNFKLKQPEEHEYYNVNDFNENAATIDLELKKAQEGSSHAQKHASTGEDPISPTSIGAAPEHYITGAFFATTDAEIDAVLLAEYAKLRDDSIGYITLHANETDLSLLGGVWHIAMYRADGCYGSIRAISYTGKGARIRERSLMTKTQENGDGVPYLTDWADNINSANFLNFVKPEVIGASPSGHTHTYAEVGAAPAKYVTCMEYVSSDADIDAKLTTEYGKLQDRSIGYIILNVRENGLSLSGGVWHFTINKDDGNYGTVRAVSYGGNGVQLRERSRLVRAAENDQGWESYWTDWDDNINSQNFGNYINLATLGAAASGHTHTPAEIGAARIETGSYIGSGTSGFSYRNKITFTGVPKAVLIAGRHPEDTDGAPSSVTATWINGIMVNTPIGGKIVSTLNGETLSWYSAYEDDQTSVGRSQLNENGVVYNYIALI